MVVQLLGKTLTRSGAQPRARVWLHVTTVIALLSGGYHAAAQELSFERIVARLPAQLAADARERLSPSRRQSVSVGDARRTAALEQLRAKPNQTEPVTVRAQAGATASARCRTGYVLRGSYRTSAQDVKVTEQQLDCDGNRCRAFQATAKREGEAPFDLHVSVTCTG